ncbi:MAG TPA: PHB depolymerase family esterase [Nevskiaceae bacterium]|nr:PHB depolymerase family esterase [Nevskiaceae bacterium]
MASATRSTWIVSGLLLALSAGCASAGGNDVGPGETRYEMKFGGRDRSYVVHVPSSGARANSALVISLHGGGGNAHTNAQQTHFNDESDREGFIVVHANGTGESRPFLNAMGKGFLFTWNAGTCCGYARDQGVDDVGFIRAMVAAIRSKYSIDPKRIYATGISNGGMLSYRLACEASDLIAAIGVVSGAQAVANCQPSQGVSVMHIHGTADQNVLLAGGIGPKGYDKVPKPPVMDAINFWVKFDGAAAQPKTTISGNLRTDYYHGTRGDVEFILITGGGHSWPGGEQMLAALDPPSKDMAATPTIWKFFVAHPKP